MAMPRRLGLRNALGPCPDLVSSKILGWHLLLELFAMHVRGKQAGKQVGRKAGRQAGRQAGSWTDRQAAAGRRHGNIEE